MPYDRAPTPLDAPRRTTLKTFAAWAGAGSGLLGPLAWAQTINTAAQDAATTGTLGASPGASLTEPLNANAQAWRAMARVGYGPTNALARAVTAAPSAKAWALQQVDAAFAASQQPPRIPPDMAHFSADLPQIFEGARRERTARKDNKALAASDKPPGGGQVMDLAAPQAPEHFTRRMALQAGAWRLTSCSQPQLENPLLARMTEFWFNHLNVSVSKGSVRPFAGHYLVHVARAHALGKFEDLLLASARHPAMLHYLDQVQSVADGTRAAQGKTRGLNENYARELMELHTLGVDGGYAQTDVRELARVLTGWTIDPTDPSGYRFAARMHDSGNKTVLGKVFPSAPGQSGEQEGKDAIRMLARHPSTAKRISLRLAQFFIADKPSADVVQRLSRTFTATQGDMRAVMRTLLELPDFWQADNRLFKTPFDFACSALAAVQADQPRVPPDRRNLMLAAGYLANAGQPLHAWPTPDGYKTDAATWLVPEALTRRADLALALTRKSTDVDFLAPYLSAATRDTIAKEQPSLRAGLMLASPDFMYK